MLLAIFFSCQSRFPPLNLAARIPAMFGFTVCDSISRAEADEKTPFPGKGEKAPGRH